MKKNRFTEENVLQCLVQIASQKHVQIQTFVVRMQMDLYRSSKQSEHTYNEANINEVKLPLKWSYVPNAK